MKIYKAKHLGFCFGVKRAIQIAIDTAHKYKNVYIKGDLVHNETVCRQIAEKGVKKISSLDNIPQGSTLIIKAHGESLQNYQKAKRKKLKIVDATCPMVKDIHKKAKQKENEGWQIVIIGDKNHQETIGILGNVNHGLIIEDKSDVEKLASKLKKKICVVCQSTQNIESVKSIVSELMNYAEEMLFINTICRPTRLRQKEIETIARQYQTILIIGSKTSANTKRIYEIAKYLNKNSYWINSAKEIKKSWLNKAKSVGITAGASTPESSIQDVIQRIKIFN